MDRHLLVVSNTHRTNLHLFGRLSSLGVDVSTSCEPILACLASKMVCYDILFFSLLLHSPTFFSSALSAQVLIPSFPRRVRSRKTRPHYSQIRDTIFHRVRDSSTILEDRREEWVSSATLGEIYHTERR